MTGFHAVSYILPNQALSRIFPSGCWSISVRIHGSHMSPRGRGISHVSNAEDCEHLQTPHRQTAPPTAMQCVRTPSRDYDHATVSMNEIGEEKVKAQVRVRWSHGNGTLPLQSASGPRPDTILAVFDMSNSIESYLCPPPRTSSRDFRETSTHLRCCVPACLVFVWSILMRCFMLRL